VKLLLLPSNLDSSPHSLHLWFARIDESIKHLEHTIYALLSPSEKERLYSIKSTNKKSEYLISRALMRHALSQQFQSPENDWDFIEVSNSQPLISNLPEDTYFSLSHRNNYISFALFNHPIGIDIETVGIKRNYLQLSEIFMNEDEINILKQDEVNQADNFYRFWCAKEAYYKAIPSSEQSTFSISEVSVPTLIKNNEGWLLFEGKTECLRLSVVTNKKPTAISYNNFPSTVDICHPKLQLN